MRSNEKPCICNAFATSHSKNPVKSSVPSYANVNFSYLRDNIRGGNEPCDNEYKKLHLCLHKVELFYIYCHRAKPVTETKRSVVEAHGVSGEKSQLWCLFGVFIYRYYHKIN